jgi:tetratricopeptide (TPR) repeat protein
MRAVPRVVALAVCLAGLAASTSAQTPPAPSPADVARMAQQTEDLMYEALVASDYDRAFSILDKAREGGLPMGYFQLLRAQIHAARRDVQAEELDLRGALYRDPTLTEAYLRLAAILEARGLWLDAADLYRGAIKATPADTRAYLSLARVMRDHERDKTALETLQAAHKQAPSDPHVSASLAAQYDRMGDTSQAMATYREAAKAAAPGPLRSLCQLKVADLSLAAREYSQAFAYYRLALAEGVPMTEELYPRVALASDESGWAALESVWGAVTQYAAGRDDAPEREEVYAAVTRALGETRQILAFLDSITPPEALKTQHARRSLQGSLLVEALVDAQTYLDTGEMSLVAEGNDRRVEAQALRKMLGTQPTTPAPEPRGGGL